MTDFSPGPIVLWLASRFENLELAEAVLLHVCRQRGLAGENEHWIGVALREALANAIKHGNRGNPDKRVYLSIGGEGDELKIEVGDEGDGFEPDAIPDPLAPENQLKTSGRGIFYMKTFMDDITFSRGESGGTVLTMRKNLRAESSTKGARIV